MYLKIALLLYFTTLIACLTLSILFKLSKAGPFRNQFMFFLCPCHGDFAADSLTFLRSCR